MRNRGRYEEVSGEVVLQMLTMLALLLPDLLIQMASRGNHKQLECKTQDPWIQEQLGHDAGAEGWNLKLCFWICLWAGISGVEKGLDWLKEGRWAISFIHN